MLSAAGFPAKTSVSLEPAKAWMEHDPGYGANLPESWASYDRATSSWRTSQGSLLEGLDEFSQTWPASGLMRSGRVYQRAPWVRHMCDDACSLWPTPTASMDGRSFGIPRHERSARYKRSTVLRV